MTAIKLYHTWFEKLRHMRSGEHLARLRIVTWMLVGIHRSRSVHLSKIAQKLPGAAQQTSKTRRLSRVLESSAIRVRDWYEPVAKGLLEEVASHGQPIRLIVDGTKVGNRHQLLMVSLAYRRRALPIAWTWVKGSRGHSLASTQVALLGYVRRLLPPAAAVVLVGDSEFGAVALMQQLDSWGWYYVLRQKGRTLFAHQDAESWQRIDQLVERPGDVQWLTHIAFTQSFAFPVNLLAYWRTGEGEPWLLATNLPTQQATLTAYKRRVWIEEMFGDFKRHGFDLERTRLRHFQRLSRLTLVVALLYLWLVAFGSSVIKRSLRFLVDRSERRDLSIFRIGSDMIERDFANGRSFTIRLLPYF